jgi:hypothetical protein
MVLSQRRAGRADPASSRIALHTLVSMFAALRHLLEQPIYRVMLPNIQNSSKY